MRVLLLEYEKSARKLAERISAFCELVMIVRLEKNLPGVWSEYEEDCEIVRIGFLEESPHSFFQVLAPKENEETCLSRPLGRIVFGRKMDYVVIQAKELIPAVTHALHGHDVKCLYTEEPVLPDDLQKEINCTPASEEEIVSKLKEAAAQNA